MRTVAVTLMLVGLVAASADAQGRGRGNARGQGQSRGQVARAQGIPPGQLPPAGQCRVWYDGVAPGRQPAPTNCDQAERIASRDRDARVIYSDGRDRGTARWGTRGNDRIYDDRIYGGRDRDRTIRGGSSRYPDRYPNARGVNTVPYNNGYRDGLEKGREDARDGDSYDPVRHSRYRSADRGYNSRYGTKDDYKLVYRDGFEAGYEQGYRDYRR